MLSVLNLTDTGATCNSSYVYPGFDCKNIWDGETTPGFTTEFTVNAEDVGAWIKIDFPHNI